MSIARKAYTGLSHQITGTKLTEWFEKIDVVATHIIMCHFNKLFHQEILHHDDKQY